MASHLFFPHFFDWWIWRSSFAWIFVTNMAGVKHHSWRRGYWKYWFVWPVIWVNFDFTSLMDFTVTQYYFCFFFDGPSRFIQSTLLGSHCVSTSSTKAEAMQWNVWKAWELVICLSLPKVCWIGFSLLSCTWHILTLWQWPFWMARFGTSCSGLDLVSSLAKPEPPG